MNKDNLFGKKTNNTKIIKIIGCGGAGIKTLKYLKKHEISDAVFFAVECALG